MRSADIPTATLFCAALLALTAGSGAAWAGDVVSPAPGAVAVTVYRDDAIPDPASPVWGGYGLGMISEVRDVTLPAGDVRLVLEGVTDGILAQTASLSGFPGRVLEQNFDFELLSPATLIEHSVSHQVQVARTNPRTGKRMLEAARLVSGPNGVLLDFGGGRVEALGCSGDPEGLVFDGVPAELTGKPTLSIRLRVAKAGTYRLRLSYMTTGLAWKAAYVARLAADDQSLQLVGWITLANHGAVGFSSAETSVVAGELARNAIRIVQPLVEQRQAACWPQGNSHHPIGVTPYLAEAEHRVAVRMYAMTAEAMMARPVGAMAPPPPPPPPPPRASESDLGDYKLYTLDEPTTVAARQTKQVAFLSQPNAAFDRVQVYHSQTYAAVGEQVFPTVTTLRLKNDAAKGLGRALPAGSVAMKAAAPDGSDLYLGAAPIRDVPVGEPFELELGASHLVTVRDVTTTATRTGDTRRTTKEITAVNASAKPATVEIRQPASGNGFRITSESEAHGTKAGDPIWRVTLPPGGSATVTYAFQWVQ
jgi:hypothetical protein